jgi:hypothetical protein
MKVLFTTIFLFCITCLHAQDLSGVWRGKLTQEPGGCFPEYYIELQIEQDNGNVSGQSYDYYDSTRFVKLQFSGRVNTTTKRMVVIEKDIVRVQIPRDCVPCVKTYDLTWKKDGNKETLVGSWKGTESTRGIPCPPGTITLARVTKSAFPPEDVVQDVKLASIQNTLKPDSRKVEVVRTLILDTNKMKIELYDNGQIDGDTISIFVNNKLIMYRNRLTEKAITLNIPVIPNKDYEMVMYAENLGTIPPNTALMVVTSGKKKYEIYLSSSEQKSSAVKFRFEKKE